MTTISNNKGSKSIWETPLDTFNFAIDFAGYEPTIDVAAESRNLCSSIITKEMDAFKVEWNVDPETGQRRDTFWLNAPNDQMKEFMPRAFYQWEKNNMLGIAILPMQSCATAYMKENWTKYVLTGKVRFTPIWKRPKFIINGKAGKWTSPFAYGLLAFDQPFR